MPVEEEELLPIASADQGEVIFFDDGFNEEKFQDYFRFDIKTTYKVNKDKVMHEFGLDLVNLTSAKNIWLFYPQ